jgi:drug/metabolite transporter (DMT)-like permease
MHSRAAAIATIACVAAAACWAGNAVVAAGAFAQGISPERLAETRVLVAIVPLLGYLLAARRDLLRPPRGVLPVLGAFGICLVGANWAYYLAIERVPVGVAISIQYTAPVLILAATALAGRRTPPGIIWLAGALTLVGVALVSGTIGRAEGGAGLDGIGLAAAVISAVTYAGYLVTAEAAGRRGVHPATTLLSGFVVAAALWAVILPVWDWPFELLRNGDLAWRIVGIGLLGTLLPFALTVVAVRWISSAVAGIATTTEPVLAAILAWIVLNQTLCLPQVIGAALVIAGVLAAQLARHPSPQATPVEIAP